MGKKVRFHTRLLIQPKTRLSLLWGGSMITLVLAALWVMVVNKAVDPVSPVTARVHFQAKAATETPEATTHPHASGPLQEIQDELKRLQQEKKSLKEAGLSIQALERKQAHYRRMADYEMRLSLHRSDPNFPKRLYQDRIESLLREAKILEAQTP